MQIRMASQLHSGCQGDRLTQANGDSWRRNRWSFNVRRNLVVASVVMAILALVSLGCNATGSSGSSLFALDALRATLDKQATAWNAGDIEGFMQAYWQSPDLTFSSGGKVIRGWRSTLLRYRDRYPDRAAMGKLSFSDLEITPLGSRHALVLGRWRLERASPIGGTFTLVARRHSGQWVILHDHTSVEEPQVTKIGGPDRTCNSVVLGTPSG